jgi:hypothetical protein
VNSKIVSFSENELVLKKVESDCFEFDDIVDGDATRNGEIFNFIVEITIKLVRYEDANHRQSLY